MKYQFLSHNTYKKKWTYESVNGLEAKYDLPLYIYNEETASANADEIRKCLGSEVMLCYSAKANYYLTEAVAKITDMVEVCTGGELECCIRQGVLAERLVYNGVWKSRQELEYAVRAGVGRIVLDSVKQVLELQNISKKPVKVLLRLSSGNQFGMNADEIEYILKNRGQYGGLDIRGIHYYAGTQRSCMRQVQRDFMELTGRLHHLENRSVCFEELQIGGGIGVPLYITDKTEEFEEAAEYMFRCLAELSRNYQITYECGRIIAANAGVYITQVFDKKKRENREILLVHGGSNHLNYYGNVVGQRQPFIESVSQKTGKEEREYMICGSLCSANDILSMKYTDRCIEEGDYLIFYNVGAYSLEEAASLFLTMEMPRILVYNEYAGKQKIMELGWKCSEFKNI